MSELLLMPKVTDVTEYAIVPDSPVFSTLWSINQQVSITYSCSVMEDLGIRNKIRSAATLGGS